MGEVADNVVTKRGREFVSQAVYSRMRSVSEAAVSKAVARGAIPLVDGKIDPELADARWFNSSRAPSVPAIPTPPAPPAVETPPPAAPDESTKRGQDDATWRRLREAQARREQHEADMVEMKARQMAGALVERVKVFKAVADAAAMLRAAFELVPDKLAERVAAEVSAARCHDLLHSEITAVLSEVAASVERLASGMDEGARP